MPDTAHPRRRRKFPLFEKGIQQMAGVKGRSGGARANAGGARPGAGRKSKTNPEKSKNSANADRKAVKAHLEPQAHGGALKRSKSKPVPLEDRDMLEFLQDVALGRAEATLLQVRAAIAAVQYTHHKLGEGGKKDAKADAAKKVASRFSPSAPPRLVVSNREK
ncbi:hypothetical protein [Burkholderia territorii]|uniref:hypothetical protein n=1 Tax=Burkholderia territorii TaxID=1503055 RepID=UPI0012DAD2F0|nr:hypothetical protein [Burkholderia territorii]